MRTITAAIVLLGIIACVYAATYEPVTPSATQTREPVDYANIALPPCTVLMYMRPGDVILANVGTYTVTLTYTDVAGMDSFR